MDHHQASVRSMTALLNHSTDTDEEKSDIADHNEDRKVSDTESHSDLISDSGEQSEDLELSEIKGSCDEIKGSCDNCAYKTDTNEPSQIKTSFSEVTDSSESEHQSEKHADHHVRFAGKTEVVQLGLEVDSVTSENGAVSLKVNDMTSTKTKTEKSKLCQEVKTTTFISLLFILIVCGVTLIYHLYHLKLSRLTKDKKLVYNIEVNSITFYNKHHDVVLRGILGVDLRLEKFPRYCDKASRSNLHGEIYEELCLNWLNLTDLEVTRNRTDDVTCYDVCWKSHSSNVILQDCYELGDGHWFGMGLFHDQKWPINSHSVGKIPFLVGMAYDSQALGSVLQPYWLSSKGVSIIVDLDVPLHVSFNSVLTPSSSNVSRQVTDNKLCLYADFRGAPYIKRGHPQLKYTVCVGNNLVDVHRFSIRKFSPGPPMPPDLTIVSNPVWSTLPALHRNLSQTMVRAHYRNIVNKVYKHGVFLLDSGWQGTLGELEFSHTLFRNPDAMIHDIKSADFQMVLSVDPYLSYSSQAFRDAVRQDLLVHSGLVPGLTRWWTGELRSSTQFEMVGVVDMFAEAQHWFSSRLLNLSEAYKLDGYYWRGGQMDVQPYYPNFRVNLSSPNEYVHKMAELGSTVGNVNIQQSAFNSQNVPMWLRIYGRQSQWRGVNGLQTVIPSVLTLSILGYPFVLPDVIGGNAQSSFPSKELYIRWLELTAFLPAMHFSIPPDHYDSETEAIAKDMITIHQMYVTPLIYEIIEESLRDHQPIIRPVWMAAPSEAETFTIDDQFMIGDHVLVAPILEEGQRARNIYLPLGIWYNKLNEYFVQGPKWLKSVNIPLNKIAYFERKPFHP